MQLYMRVQFTYPVGLQESRVVHPFFQAAVKVKTDKQEKEHTHTQPHADNKQGKFLTR